MSEEQRTRVRRRDFLKASSVATAGLVLVKPGSAFGATANSRIQLGAIGPGGRGTHDAGVFVTSSNVQITGIADAFRDRLDQAKAKLDEKLLQQGRAKIDRLFVGMEAYKELLASGVDAVLITSPPYYHAEQIEAAVDAGIHAYSEKPVATDVFGAKRVIKAGEKAKANGISIEVGFQLRSSKIYQEAAERVARGDIGEFVCGQVYYHAGALTDRSKPGESKDQTRLRNWVFDIALSGDIIVEQNVHCIDMANWFLGALPVKAIGNGGQRVRTGLGDCYDHFQVLYTYPNDVQISFTSTQFLKGWGDVAVRVYGSKGVLEIHYSDNNKITGDNAFKWEGDPFDTVEERRVSGFVDSIITGKPVNSAESGANSALSCILGRMAAYTGREYTWNKMMRSNQRFRVDLDVA